MNKFASTCILALALSACGGGGGGGSSSGSGGSGSSLPPAAAKTPPPNLPPAHFGVAAFGDDSYGPGALDVVTLFDSSGAPLATPHLTTVAFPYMFDFEDIAVAPDGTSGVVADGARTLRVFTGLPSGTPTVSATILDITANGNDLDAVRMLQNGDEAVLATDTTNNLYLVSGIRGGAPAFAQGIPTPDLRNGLVLSSDDTVLLARGYTGVTVYAVAAISPVQGPLGGWVYHSFTQTANITSLPVLDAADARGGMASDPADPSHALVVGGSSVVELNGLPASPAAGAAVAITGARNAFAAAISPDGTTGFVGTDSGIAVFTGIASGTPVFAHYSTIAVAGGDTLSQVSNVAVTKDGKYLVAVARSARLASGSDGYLVVLPIVSGALGAPVITVPHVPVPDNNQLLVQ